MSRKRKIAVGSAVAVVVVSLAIVSVSVLAASLNDGIYRSLVMKQTAAVMSKSLTSGQERVQGMFARFVEQTPIPTGGVAGDPEFPAVIDDHAWGTLVRGRAYCDSQLMVLAQVLSQAGFRAQLLFLYDENGISPHSVATVNIDGDWRVLDPLYGAIPVSQDGTWVSVDEMKDFARDNRQAGYSTSEARRDQGYRSAFVPAAWFIDSEVFWDSENDGLSGIRRGIDSLVSMARPLLWPLVLTVRPSSIGNSMYLPNLRNQVTSSMRGVALFNSSVTSGARTSSTKER